MIISRIKTEIIRILILYIYIYVCMFQNTFNGQKRQRITRLLNLFLRYFSLGLKANRIGNTPVAFIDGIISTILRVHAKWLTKTGEMYRFLDHYTLSFRLNLCNPLLDKYKSVKNNPSSNNNNISPQVR